MSSLASLPFDVSIRVLHWLNLPDLLQMALVHTTSNRHVQSVIASRDSHDLLKDSHLFISRRNWKAALCAIIKSIRRPGAMLTYAQRLDSADIRTNAILAVHITGAGIINLQISYDWQISPDDWLNIGRVMSPMCVDCGIYAKCRTG